MRAEQVPGSPHQVALSFDVDALSLWIGSFKATNSSMISRGEFDVPATGRILALLERLGLQATFFVPGHTALAYPELVNAIASHGHEIGHHGFVHERTTELAPGREREVLGRGIEILSSLLGDRPLGYRSPSWEFTEHTPALLVEYGFAYDSSLMASDFEPYWVRSGDRFTADGPYEFGREVPIVEMPVSWVLDDFPYFEFVRGVNQGLRPASDVLEIWTGEFRYFRNRLEGGCFTLTMHPQIVGRGHRMLMLEQLLEEMMQRGAAFVTLERAAAAWKASHTLPTGPARS
jgi:peptidoglycan/xylan/chitin deacetylase (PgdA/CDA1 family)